MSQALLRHCWLPCGCAGLAHGSPGSLFSDRRSQHSRRGRTHVELSPGVNVGETGPAPREGAS